MIGYRFTEFIPDKQIANADFETLWKIFRELLLITGGEVAQTSPDVLVVKTLYTTQTSARELQKISGPSSVPKTSVARYSL